MSQKQQKNIKEKIVEAALKLAAEKGWDKTSLADIAKAAKISLPKLHEEFDDKADILNALGRMIDKKVLERVGKTDPDTPPKERLFDVLMERYDVLQEYRTGIVAILDSFLPDPKQGFTSLPHLCRSMTWMLEATGFETAGIPGALRVAGLTGIHIKSLWVWKGDDSEDLSKTMAALDKDLNRAEQLANMLGF
jgi:AcrR family transcriptional regulator